MDNGECGVSLLPHAVQRYEYLCRNMAAGMENKFDMNVLVRKRSDTQVPPMLTM